MSSRRDLEYDDWPIQGKEQGGSRWIGTLDENAGMGGVPVLYEEETDTVYRVDVDEDAGTLIPRPGTERPLDPGETLGDVLEELGEEIGWDSLSSFAEEHLKG